MASKVKSTTIILCIYVLLCAIWLDGRIDAEPNNQEKAETHYGGKTALCGGTFNTAPGEIEHPLTPGGYYNPNEICTWIIRSSVSLAFYFSKFNLEEDYDHVSIRNGGNIGSSLIAELTGKSVHYNFTTIGDAYVEFESDLSVVGTGFVLHWRVYSAEDQCNDDNGFCVQTGGRCEGTFKLIQNSCGDHCACCLPDDKVIHESIFGSKLYSNINTVNLHNRAANFTGLDTEAPPPCDGVMIANQCLKFSTEQLSWEDAKERCASQNARLAVLKDALEFQNYALSNYGSNKFWLGGSDSANEGEFAWITGQPLGDQFPWGTNQPDNAAGIEDCLMWGYKGEYNDDPCQRTLGFVCEMKSEGSSWMEDCNTCLCNSGVPISTTEACPGCDGTDMFRVKQQCFKVFRDTRRPWIYARYKCTSENLILAEPTDDNAAPLRKYMVETYGSLRCWLGARGDGSKFVWESSGRSLLMDDPLWDRNGPVISGVMSWKICLELDVTARELIQAPSKPYDYFPCEQSRWTLCEVH